MIKYLFAALDFSDWLSAVTIMQGESVTIVNFNMVFDVDSSLDFLLLREFFAWATFS